MYENNNAFFIHSDVTLELVHMLVAKQRKHIDNIVERAILYSGWHCGAKKS